MSCQVVSKAWAGFLWVLLFSVISSSVLTLGREKVKYLLPVGNSWEFLVPCPMKLWTWQLFLDLCPHPVFVFSITPVKGRDSWLVALTSSLAFEGSFLLENEKAWVVSLKGSHRSLLLFSYFWPWRCLPLIE